MPIRGLQLKEKTLPDNTEIDPGDDETDDNDMIEQKLTTEDQPVVPSKMIKEDDKRKGIYSSGDEKTQQSSESCPAEAEP
ncbi:hypothetical protein HA402_005413 [Bradysia odoriphaga]|nr:hypothetical protein HA402_005413 [Bradysia odoriphaga]